MYIYICNIYIYIYIYIIKLSEIRKLSTKTAFDKFLQ